MLAGAGYTTQTRNYTVDAIQRSTLHSYPTGGSAQPLLLVIVLHGDGGTAAGIRAALPLEAQANGAAAFSYLSSAGGSFEYWTDTGRGHEGRFVQAVIANYGVAGVTIDPARVYLVGFSGGGTMAQALGCRLGAGVPAAKLAVGTGFYGTCYQRVTAPDQVTQGDDIVGSDGTFSYRNIVANYLPGMSANYDAAASAPWLSSAGGVGPVGARCNYLTYENAASIAAKGNYVRAQGLGGTIIWTIAQGHRPDLPVGDPNQLLRAVKAGFLD